MRIGIDFDGTFADVVQGKIALARELFAIELPPDRTWPAEAASVIGEERYALLEGVLYGTSRTSEIPPVDGSVEVSRRLAEHHELIVLTARTDKERGPAEAWIERHAVPITRFIHTNRAPKPPVCAELGIDILLDDWEHSFVDMRRGDRFGAPRPAAQSATGRTTHHPRRQLARVRSTGGGACGAWLTTAHTELAARRRSRRRCVACATRSRREQDRDAEYVGERHGRGILGR